MATPAAVLSILVNANTGKANAALATTQAELKKTAAASDVMATRFATAGSKMQSVGKSLTKNVSLPLVAIGAVAIKSSLDFHQSMRLIQTQAGASAKEVDKLSKRVLAFSASGQTDKGPKDLANALYRVESAGIRGGRAMKTLRSASNLAMVGQADLEATTKSLVAAQQTGIKGSKNLTKEIATLNSIVGHGQMRMDDLVSAMGTGFLSAAQGLGLTLKDVGGALAELTKQGVPATQAATRLRMTFSLIANPTTKAVKSLKEIGISQTELAMKMRGPQGLAGALGLLRTHLGPLNTDLQKTKAAQLLAGAFGGAKSGSTIVSLIAKLDDLRKITGQINPDVKQFNKNLEAAKATKAEELKIAWAQLQAALVRLGDVLIPVIIPAIQSLADGLMHLSNWFDKLPAPTKRFGVYLLLAAVAIGPLTTGVGFLFSGFGKLLMILPKVAVALRIVAAAAIANPWVLLAVAVVAAAVLIITHWKQVKNFLSNVWGWIKDHATIIAAVFLLSGPVGAMVGVTILIIKHWKQVKGALGSIWDWIKNAAKNTFGAVAGFASDLAGKISGAVKGGLNMVIGFINDIIGVLNKIPFVEIGKVGAIGSGGGGGVKMGGHDKHAGKHAGGGAHGATGAHAQRGGVMVPGYGTGDKVPAMLEPGEVVINRKAVAAMGGAQKANAINQIIPRFAGGGEIQKLALGGISFPSGSLLGGAKVTDPLGSISAGASDFVGALPHFSGPSWLSDLGSGLREGAIAYAKDKVSHAFGILGGGGSTKGPKGVGSFGGVPMANWVIASLRHAQKAGVTVIPTSGYRPGFDPNTASGTSEHAGTQYPHGAVDFGGYNTGLAMKMAVVNATRGFKYPLLAPIGFHDDGHASGTGHMVGGIIQKLRRGGAVASLPSNWAHMTPKQRTHWWNKHHPGNRTDKGVKLPISGHDPSLSRLQKGGVAGFGSGRYTVKGAPASGQQKNTAAEIMRVIATVRANKLASEAILMAATQESVMGAAGNTFQLTGPKQGVTPGSSAYAQGLAWMRKGFYGQGGGLSLSHKLSDPGAIAQAVEGSAHPSAYSPWRGEADRWIAGWTGGKAAAVASAPGIGTGANTPHLSKKQRHKLKHLKGVIGKLGLSGAMQAKLDQLTAKADRFAELADHAGQLSTDTTQAVLQGKDEAGWLQDELSTLFSLRNALITAQETLRKAREKIAQMLKAAGAQKLTPKQAAKVQKQLSKELKKPKKKQNPTKIAALRAKLASPDVAKALTDQLTSKDSALSTKIGDVGSSLSTVQGLTSPKKVMSAMTPAQAVQSFGGSIFDVAKQMLDLGSNQQVTDTGTESESAALLRQLLQQSNQRFAVSQAQYPILQELANVIPFGGSFATGGVVPGSIGQPVMIEAHGGETVSPVGAPEIHIHVDPAMSFLRDYIRVEVGKQGRRATRGVGRTPGSAGSLRG